MAGETEVPDLTDSFWGEDYSSELHAPTVLSRIRAELSHGRLAPITVAEVFLLAAQDMGFRQKVSHFAKGELGRPLSVVAAVWGFKVYGLSNEKARSFGGFIGAKAGGDVVLGPPADRWEKAACQLLQRQLGRSDELGPEQTTRLIDEVITLYKG